MQTTTAQHLKTINQWDKRREIAFFFLVPRVQTTKTPTQ